MTGPLPLSLAVCRDCGGAGVRFEARAYLHRDGPRSHWRMQSRVVPAACRSCRRHGRYQATEATG